MSRALRLVLLAAVLMPSCASAKAEPTAASPSSVREPIAIALSHGEAKRVAGTPLTITFEAVTDDSRCPEGVSCVWAGDAVVHIRIEGGTPPASTAMLHVNGQFDRDVVHGSHRVTLVAVAPHPKADAKIEAKDYRIELRIDEE
jgi:hypothetical protein